MIHQRKREGLFDNLVQEVRDCLLCSRMSGSCRILGRSSGRLDSPLLFIGEAPGRLGADDTEIPFHGDRAGENFERLISQVGISRYDCFITNAVLCNPRDDKGNNATPSRREIANCSGFLKRQIDLLNPKIVVTLGIQALHALSLIEPHCIELASGVRRSWNWYGRILIPLYHPGQRATLHRSFLNQLADYRFVSERLRRVNGRKPQRNARPRTKADAANLARLLLEINGPISYFRLHKLCYLLEYHHVRTYGRRLTTSYVVRQKDGPYFTDLHLSKLKRSLPDIIINERNGAISLALYNCFDLFSPKHGERENQLAQFVHEIVTRYRGRSDEQLKTAVYLTSPMRSLLRREKYDRENLFNAPIDFSDVYR